VIAFRIGLNKGLGIMLLCVAGLNLVTFALTATKMQLGLGLVLGLAGLLYLLGPAMVVEIEQHGGGAVLAKNPFGMTLRTYRFTALSDFTVRGNKITVRSTDGRTKTIGGFGMDGASVRRLADYLRSNVGR
jgi:hypothetical protein